MEHSPKYSNRTVTKQATQLDLSLPVGSSARVKTPFSYYLVHSSATFKSPYTVQRETLAGEGKFGKLQAKSQLAKKNIGKFKPRFYSYFICYKQLAGKILVNSQQITKFAISPAKVSLYTVGSSDRIKSPSRYIPTSVKSLFSQIKSPSTQFSFIHITQQIIQLEISQLVDSSVRVK